ASVITVREASAGSAAGTARRSAAAHLAACSSSANSAGSSSTRADTRLGKRRAGRVISPPVLRPITRPAGGVLPQHRAAGSAVNAEQHVLLVGELCRAHVHRGHDPPQDRPRRL